SCWRAVGDFPMKSEDIARMPPRTPMIVDTKTMTEPLLLGRRGLLAYRGHARELCCSNENFSTGAAVRQMRSVLNVGSMTDERRIRTDLAACYRLVAHFGWDDLVFTHISARLPGGRFLINPYGMLFDEITASSLVEVDASGEKTAPSEWPVNPAG